LTAAAVGAKDAGAARFLNAHDSRLALRCPMCASGLKYDSPTWHCLGQPVHVHPDIEGVPVLLNPARSVFRAEDFQPRARTTFKNPAPWALKLGRWLPSPSRDVSSVHCRRRLTAMLAARPVDRRRVLVVGCGDGTAGYGELADVEGALWLETDVSLAGRARIVCDASDLPFHDGGFDLIICIAVLEHVLEPQRCVDEMRRVLAIDGLIYATTPFMQQVHMGEFDFTRFTRSGHRWLFREFHEEASGLATGPASVLVWSVEYFLLAWTSSVALRRVFKGITRLLLGWLTLLDPILARRAAALDGGGGFYFIGRRASESAIDARAMMNYYRGADAVK
jgi:SAM-dependent methyltransferase